METPEELFELWYVQPLRNLEKISDGAGAFIALATSCFLFERYADAIIENAGKKPNPKSRVQQLMTDFGVDEETADIFWKVMRNGILHKGMPKRQDYNLQLPPWRFLGEFTQPVKLCKIDEKSELQVQPWLFMNKVINLWENNLDLLDRNQKFPWAKIVKD
jgi:hypothetical protein